MLCRHNGTGSFSVGTRLIASLALCSVAVLPTACAGKARFEPPPSASETTPSASSVGTRTAEVTSSVPAQTELPKGFPADFPIYGGSLVKSARVLTPGNKPVLAVIIRTADSAQVVKRFYMTEPTKSGWVVKDAGEGEISPGQKAYFVTINNDSYHGVVRVNTVNGLTTIGVNLIVQNP